MNKKQHSHKRFQIFSLLLVLLASAVVTVSDYRTSLDSVMVQSENYANRVASHLSSLLITHSSDAEGMVDLESPISFKIHQNRVENVISGFELENIRIFNGEGLILFSLDRSVIGNLVEGNRSLSLALSGINSSHVATPKYHEKTYGNKARFPMLETYVPIVHPETERVLGAYEIYQDYRPLRSQVISETFRASVTHIFLFLVFAALFYRYGRVTIRIHDQQQQTLIKELEERVEERTFELKRSRDRISDLLEKKDEMFRDLMIADEYKKSFMGLVSHELRTPLTVIKGYLTLLRDGDLSDDQAGSRQAVNTCLDESSKLEVIINNILELSQLERGIYDLSGEEFELKELINDAIETVEPELGDKKISFNVQVDEQVERFSTDRLKVLQVLQQLISNAVKFSSDDGKVTVGVSASHRGMVFSVADEGVGIPDAQVNDIFSLFYQVDISTTRNYEGSGLGLAIVRSIAQILGGRAWVQSKEGEGSTFFFEIPALNGIASPVQPTSLTGVDAALSDRSMIPSPGVSSKTVLVIDDDDEYLFLLRKLLVEEGYNVEICHDALQGLNRLYGPNHPPLPAIILLDVRMPHINGIDMLRIVRRNIVTRETPVIVVSALGQESQIQEGFKAGANAYFVKPLDHEVLMARMAFLLGEETQKEE
jgi:signal transduction histidine kinase/CheY-like chemotaxis protein